MLTSIEIGNFKSFKKATMPLAPLTLLIGPNASGKSNALEAIRLLSWLAEGSRLEDIEKSLQGESLLIRGRTSDLFRNNREPSIRLGCHIQEEIDNWKRLKIDIGFKSKHGVIVDVYSGGKIEYDPFDLVITNESVTSDTESSPLYQLVQLGESLYEVMYNNFKNDSLEPHIPCSNHQAIFYQLETPARFDKNDTKSQEVIPTVTKAFRKALQNIVFLDFQPSKMRNYSSALTTGEMIYDDGNNLSAVLFQLCKTQEGGKEFLLKFVKSLPEQNIQDIQFIQTERMDVMIQLVESFGGTKQTIDAPLLSDGTLRVMAIAAALLTSPEGSLVVIEEIDNGVHPSRAESLIHQIQAVAQKRNLRVLLTSHNPALLNALPDDALGDVLCCYRDPDEGDSRITRLGDLDRYPELVAQGPLGYLMTKGTLDRFLKDKTTPEERKQKALAWVEDLKRKRQHESDLSD